MLRTFLCLRNNIGQAQRVHVVSDPILRYRRVVIAFQHFDVLLKGGGVSVYLIEVVSLAISSEYVLEMVHPSHWRQEIVVIQRKIVVHLLYS